MSLLEILLKMLPEIGAIIMIEREKTTLIGCSCGYIYRNKTTHTHVFDKLALLAFVIPFTQKV